MAQLLAKKVVAINGCSSGIGRATAIEFARHGARLVLHHVGDTQSREDIRTLKDEILAINETLNIRSETVDVSVDVTKLEAGERIVEAALSGFGEINGAVHNAGICQFADFAAVTRPQLDRHMSVNFAGPFTITQAITRQMIAQGKGGSIVSIASIMATMGSSQLTHYSPTKAAMLGMTVSCAVALGKYGIRFNAVSPGTIETAMNREDRGAKRTYMEGGVPLGRLGVPVDIAGPVVFFTSDLAQYVSGQNLIVDGAASINYQ